MLVDGASAANPTLTHNPQTASLTPPITSHCRTVRRVKGVAQEYVASALAPRPLIDAREHNDRLTPTDYPFGPAGATPLSSPPPKLLTYLATSPGASMGMKCECCTTTSRPCRKRVARSGAVSDAVISIGPSCEGMKRGARITVTGAAISPSLALMFASWSVLAS